MAKLVKITRFVREITDDMVKQELAATVHDPELGQSEIDKCKASPYYFYTHYFMINGKPATTTISEEEFNKHFNKT